MPSFGNNSEARLSTCHEFVIAVCRRAIAIVDFSVLCGHRNEAWQNMLYAMTPQRSKKRWANSRHNSNPSMALDEAPYPILWGEGGGRRSHKDRARFYWVAGVLAACTEIENELRRARGELTVFVFRSGCDWDGDLDFNDQTFDDLGHAEWREVPI